MVAGLPTPVVCDDSTTTVTTETTPLSNSVSSSLSGAGGTTTNATTATTGNNEAEILLLPAVAVEVRKWFRDLTKTFRRFCFAISEEDEEEAKSPKTEKCVHFCGTMVTQVFQDRSLFLSEEECEKCWYSRSEIVDFYRIAERDSQLLSTSIQQCLMESYVACNNSIGNYSANGYRCSRTQSLEQAYLSEDHNVIGVEHMFLTPDAWSANTLRSLVLDHFGLCVERDPLILSAVSSASLILAHICQFTSKPSQIWAREMAMAQAKALTTLCERDDR